MSEQSEGKPTQKISIIEKWHLNIGEEAFFDGETGEKLECLKGLSKVNLIVAPNNSGKSRFLRLLSNNFEPRVEFEGILKIEEFKEFLNKTASKFEEYISHFNLRTGRGKLGKGDLSFLRTFPYFEFTGGESTQKKKFNAHLDINSSYISSYSEYGQETRNPSSINDYLQELSNKKEMSLKQWSKFEEIFDLRKPQVIYIPILRGIRRLGDTKNEDFYQRRTEKDYFSSKNKSEIQKNIPIIFTGHTLYTELKEMLLGSLRERNLVAEYQCFLAKNLFEGQEVALIPNIKANTLCIKIGDEEEKEIAELGDGIQSLLIMTFPLFRYKSERPWLFIEEPETHLHPGMQRRLLDIFTNAKEHHDVHVFATTHSNHLLDMTANYDNISVFSLKKKLEDPEGIDQERKPKFYVFQRSKGDSLILEELGVRPSSAFLVNATIWVEGVTDRLYIRKYLEMYFKEFPKLKVEEDYHYSFIEYGGSNIRSWSFVPKNKDKDPQIAVEKLCARGIVIADNDDPKEGSAKKELQDALKKRMSAPNAKSLYILLPVREIENLIPPGALKKVVKSYETLKNVELPEFKYEDYKDLQKPLGTYLNEQLEMITTPDKSKRFAAKSGTINDKANFARETVKLLDDEDWKIAKDIKAICKQIVDFVRKQNGLPEIFEADAKEKSPTGAA